MEIVPEHHYAANRKFWNALGLAMPKAGSAGKKAASLNLVRDRHDAFGAV